MLSHLFAITCVCWYVHFLFTTLCFSHKVLLIGLTKSKSTTCCVSCVFIFNILLFPLCDNTFIHALVVVYLWCDQRLS